MKTPGLLLTLLILTLSATAQRFVEPDKMKSFNITVNYPDYTVKTQMLKDPKKLRPDPDLTYHWYVSQKIMETKGGFDGKLLHGTYRSFYLNDQLFESGEFKYGVKAGEWKNWYPDGKLKEICHWKNGRKNGSYVLYSDYGKVMANGTFRRDLLNGTFTTYDNTGKISSVRKYKNGQEIIKKEKVKKAKTPKREKTPQADATEKPKEKKLFRRKASDAKTESKTGDNNKDSNNAGKTEQKKKEAKPKDKPASEKKSFGKKLKSFFRKKPATETKTSAGKPSANT